MAETLWELNNVSLGHPAARRLDEVSLTVQDGVTAVIGPSGAGKTSLLNLLAQFERPSSGEMVAHLPAGDRRPSLAWVPPDFGLWPHLTVRQHLDTVQTTSRQASHISDLLDAFGLRTLADAHVGRLSQGERSRLSVARALCCDPVVLVMDEPLVHVDPTSLDTYWRTIRDHCRQQDTTLVFSTHSPESVLREASRVICLDRGHVSYEGELETLYVNPPTQQLARLLGPSNWFAADETAHWLPDHEGCTTAVCVRPDWVRLTPANGAGLRLHSSRSVGTLVESDVEHEATNDRRTIVHRPGEAQLVAGTHVLLRLCAVLLMCLTWTGCQSSVAGPELPVTNTRTIKMPSDGSSVPAPRSLTVSPDGELYVLDNAGRVLVYDTEGTLNREWRMPAYDVGKPEGVCVLSDGTIAVADTHYHRVVVFTDEGEVLRMFGEHGEEPGQFIYPVAITRDDSGHLYVAEYGGNDRIQKFTEDGAVVTTFGSFGTDEGQFQRPSGVVWLDGNIYVADAINNRVHVYSDAGEYQRTIVDSAREGSVEVNYPYDIALGPDQSLFLVEYGAGRVTQVDIHGNLLGRHGSVGRNAGNFYTPWGIAVDQEGRIFVADTGNHRTVELSL